MIDLEVLLLNIETILKANINNEIDLINASKADTITLGYISDNAYCMQSLDDSVFNYDPIIFYGLTGNEVLNNGPQNIQTLTFDIMVIAADDTDGKNMTIKMLRYQEVLKRVIEKNWHKGVNSNRINLKGLMPISVVGLNDSNEHRVIGVQITTSIA